MNLKLNNNDVARRSLVDIETAPLKRESIKEERRRTGRYIAILVGISLFLLAIYHAWVRRIPIVASLVVPALIMFIYVGWVLYTASRDKHKLMALDAAAALNMASLDGIEHDVHCCEHSHSHAEITIISSREASKHSSPETQKKWPENTNITKHSSPESPKKSPEISINMSRREKQNTNDTRLLKPIILVNDKLAEDSDEKRRHLVENLVINETFRGFQNRKKFKRKFCRSKRHAVFKRSYSIA